MQKFSNHYYNKNLKTFARQNRKNATLGESILWSKLRNKQFLGLRFLRQRAMNNYILDFFCPELNLAIEIDGSTHDENKFDYDAKRQHGIESKGITVLRFTKYQVKTKLNDVLQTIEQILKCY